MAWDKGFNFRATDTYVTDGTNETYSLGEAYPVTRNDVTFGWSIDNTGQSRNRNSSLDRRLAGVVFRLNSSAAITFRVDLPATGDYTIRLAAGDASNAQDNDVELGDDTSYETLLDSANSSSGSFFDATGTQYSAANWPESNTAITRTFSSTILNIRVSNLSAAADTTCLAHLFVSQVTTERRWLFGAHL